jgi:hypothetical protein
MQRKTGRFVASLGFVVVVALFGGSPAAVADPPSEQEKCRQGCDESFQRCLQRTGSTGLCASAQTRCRNQCLRLDGDGDEPAEE